MARLFGLIGNRADLAARVLHSEADALRVRAKSTASAPPSSAAGHDVHTTSSQTHYRASLGWGLGFYQGDEVLMRRRPIDDRDEIDVATLAGDVRADVLIGHVRSATVGTLRTENTHPFRYRQWLFAKTGTLSQFDAIRDRLVASIPEFLRGGIRGETDSELLFHVFLSFLHDRGRLNDATIEPSVVREAVRSSIAVVDGMTAEVGGEEGTLNVLVTNGEYIIGAHRRDHMCYRVLAGKSDADAIIGDDQGLRRKTPELSQMHFVIVASDFDEGPPPRWKPVADRAIVTLTRGEDPIVEAF
jgi:predicted glutamine amidotransferase